VDSVKRIVLACGAFLLGVLVAVGGFPLGLGTDKAVAAETPALVHAATNGSVVVGADSSGKLWWSDDDGDDGTWEDSGTALSKNGVTSLIWTGDKFIATSFFSFARSDDGKNWTVRVFPLGEAFDPGNIISDDEFFQRGVMSVDDIQEFLDSKVTDCRDGYVCLPEFEEDTWDREETVLCQAYDGEGDESAAEIIYKVQEACGVSARVLIALIQKEMGLVTHTWPSQWRFDKATGYACPDTAPCDERYYGFYNQVYNAAKQFKRYANPPGTSRFFTWYPVGKSSNVRWHPRSSCGTSPVTIQNQATAGLYYYTPYAPNEAAMANLTGTGDACSSYGNRNFWRLYNYWFNPTKAVDGDGYFATSTNGVSWIREGRVPDVGGSNRIAEFGLTDEGNLAVLTVKGNAWETDDLDDWDSLEVVQSSEPQNFVTTHTVASGDTVWAIARNNGVSVKAVVDENALPGDGSLIRVGQQLTITKTGQVQEIESPIETDSTRVLQPLVTQQGESDEVYVVKRGDTLIRIAFRNGTTVSALREANDIRNVNLIYIGQRIIVGSADQEQKFHRVESGDTVAIISDLRDVPVSTILALNSSLQSNSTLEEGSLVRVE
jgi:LysM repeat protein